MCISKFISSISKKKCIFSIFLENKHNISPITIRTGITIRGDTQICLYYAVIEMTLILFSCKDSPDVIRVHDGSTYDSPVIAEYCKTLNKRRVYSSGSDLFVELTTDGKKQSQGFAATFEFVQRSRTTTTPTMVTPCE